MARRSKRLAIHENKFRENKRIYNTAVYLRLSVEEKRDKKDNEALTNQKDIILDFIKNKPDIKVYDIYSDNGETGTSFERKEFQRMMYDIYSNRVNCIIVKDLSRFGREYIEAGNYLDKIFPLLGVRFIAINDNVDNHVSPFDISVPIKNIVNAMYARDISKKSSAALKMKQINGEFIGGQAPYGYLINPEDNHKIIIDPKTESTVKQIFEWKAAGRSYREIIRKLHEQNIMPPARYKFDSGIIKDKRFAKSELWNTATIKSILTSQTYIGNITQGKTKSVSLDGGGRKKISAADWIVAEGTHEPIISEELFYKVREELEKTRKSYFENAGKYHRNNNNPFKGKIICGECGCKMERTAAADKKSEKAVYTYKCRKKTNFPDLCCLMPVAERTLNNIVMLSIRSQIMKSCDFRDLEKKLLSKENVRAKRAELTRKRSNAMSKIGYLRDTRISLTKKYAKGLLNDKEYEKEEAEIDKQLADETDKLEQTENARDNFDNSLSLDKWIYETEKEKGEKYPTKEMIDAFVKQITVYNDRRIEIAWAYGERKADASELKGC